jgi:2-dehydro-3-deoxyglucarate aldolase
MFAAIEKFKEQLAAGELIIGTTVAIADPLVCDALADSVDFLWIDQEHTTINPESLRIHLLAIRGRSKPALVRVSGPGPEQIKPVLDAGAHGIIVPQLESAEQVRRAISECRYPPAGCRGFGPLIPTDYGRQGDGYVERANAGIFAAVMIETAGAVEEIAEIVATPGLDSIVLGPYDLSGSLGMLGDVAHPTVVAAMEKAITAARDAGVYVGSGMPVDTDFAALQVRRGVQWLQMGADLDLLIRSMDQITREVREKIA